jgi:hypothetical protein
MVKLSKGDIVKVHDGGTAIVLDVYPSNCGIWAMYRNPIGEIDCRGYASQLVGDIIGHISLDRVEAILNGK